MRDGYKNDIYEPFTWEELSYVAHEQMFGRFISFENNRIIIYEDHIDKVIVTSYWGSTFNYEEKTDEEKFLRLSKESQTKIIDSLQYQQLLDELNNPSPKEREPIKKITWWDKLWVAKEPIFETKEWKEYLADRML